MSIFRRLADIIKANINDLLSRAEDPEKMLNQMLIEMREQLAKAKRQVAVAIADEKKLRRQLDEQLELVRRWEQKAMLALQQGDENLAKRALARKKEHEKLAQELRTQWESQSQSVEQLKTALRGLQNKIEEAKRKKDLLIARQKRAEAQRAIQETLQGISETSAFEVFARMEAKIEDMEIQAEVATELGQETTSDQLEAEFATLEAEGVDLDAELADLKKRMGMVAAEEEEKETVSVERKVEI